MEDMCRVCLKSKKDCPNASQFISLFIKTVGDKDKIFKKIMKCATVKIKRTDEFPKYICKECFNNLETAYNFKVQCETSNQSFQDFLITEAITEINGNSSDTNGIGKEELLMVIRKRGRPKKQKDKNIFVKGFCKNSVSSKCLVSSIEEENELTVKLEEDFVYNSFDEDLVTEEIVPEARRGRGRPKKIYGSGQHLAAKPKFVCDQCGKSFKLMESLKGHQRRHTGEKPFTCSTCGKSFHVINELKKHSNTHTGTKPYSCKYCERKFTDWGSRFKHERCHRGERPYHCEMCPKTFSYSYVLNRHKLTHSGNKAFSCDLCKKQFTLKYHLTNHNRKYHKETKSPEKADADHQSPLQIAIEGTEAIIGKYTECFMETPTESIQLVQVDSNNAKHISFTREEPQIVTIASNIYEAQQINCYNVVKIEKLDREKEFVKAKIKMY